MIGSRETEIEGAGGLRERLRFRLPSRRTWTGMIPGTLSGSEVGSGKDLMGPGSVTSVGLRKESIHHKM